MVESIAREVVIQKDYLGNEHIHTIYFGGGTPSMLERDELNLLLTALHNNFSVAPDSEITLEANPDDLDKQKLTQLKEQGINRLSIGIQSFNDEALRLLNRVHNAETAKACVKDAREAGFSNISIDLIYSIPNQDDSAWVRNIEAALALNPEHISAYSLTIEEKTVFGRWITKGKFKPVHDDIAARQMEILIGLLESAGFEHYEVSNFCQPGFQSRHNSNYWRQEKYLGLGPSAHSFNGSSRQYNISNNHLYLKALKDGKIPCQAEALTRADQINEYILTTLRTSWGCDTKWLLEELGFDLIGKNRNYIARMLEGGLVTVDEHAVLRLTRQGKLLADAIASDLFIMAAF